MVQIVPSEYTVQESAPPALMILRYMTLTNCYLIRISLERVALIQDRMKVMMKKHHHT